MTDQYIRPTYTGPIPTATPPPGQMPPLPPSYPVQPTRKPKAALFTAVAIGAVAIALTAGAIGGLIGNHIAGNTARPAAAVEQHTPPTPTTEQVHAATVDLCTRFAGAYAAMPSPQNTGFDVIPTANYISDALRDDPAADSEVREAIQKSLGMLREHVAVSGGRQTQGAIQMPTDWTAAAANEADQRVWNLCKTYGD